MSREVVGFYRVQLGSSWVFRRSLGGKTCCACVVVYVKIVDVGGVMILTLILLKMTLFRFTPIFRSLIDRPPPTIRRPLPRGTFICIAKTIGGPKLCTLRAKGATNRTMRTTNNVVTCTSAETIGLTSQTSSNTRVRIPCSFRKVPRGPTRTNGMSLGQTSRGTLATLPNVKPTVTTGVVTCHRRRNSFNDVRRLRGIGKVNPTGFTGLGSRIYL